MRYWSVQCLMTGSRLDSHEDLLNRARAGDPAAFGELVDKVAVRLLGFLRRSAGRSAAPDADEEDLFQTVLAHAWRLLPGFEDRGPESFYRWLVTIAKHSINDRLKYLDAKGRGAMHTVGGDDGAWSQIADSLTSVSRCAMRRESWERVARALDTLDAKHSVVVTLHLLEGLSLAEIGASLGITKNAVWERLHHGLAGLRERLGSEV